MVAVRSAHEGQKRADGVIPYITHLEFVGKLTREWGISELGEIAARSHDVEEDAEPEAIAHWREVVKDTYSTEDADQIFKMVYALTKPARGEEYPNRAMRNDEATRRLLEGSKEYPEVILIKIADRYHNTLTIYDKDRGFWKKYYKETLELITAIEESAKIYQWDIPLNHLMGAMRELETALKNNRGR